MALQIHDPFPAIGESELQAFETRHGIALPPAYRAFLLRNNGGRPEPDLVDGKVHAWDHEEEAADGEPPTMRNVALAADDFETFLTSLRSF